ncbi:MAG TPA: PspC domain-containing protein [Candidatus Dormibacteraeota bacterium]
MSQSTGTVLRRGSDRVLGGVCSGLAEYFGVDPLFVRIVFVVLTILQGAGILIYFVLWLLMKPPVDEPTGPKLAERLRTMGDEIRSDFRGDAGSGGATVNRTLWLGVILIGLGAYFLISNLGLLNGFRWDLFWPAVLIAIGVFVLVRRR